ncbi:MAG: hypothetical protein A3F18_06330 [Legionellales bacterium RIFCSPHIGHO2_12_FULL_37_14]|nr:MAG: hypothetical protein A3F18_06330 [Legionellales bacterium RIFCSPHIGHO2_12_FULL_37_14]
MKSIIHSCVIIIAFALLTSCATKRVPSNVNHICYIFKEYPSWYQHTKKVERIWHVPVPVQMAIVHQESRFDAYALPPKKRLLGFIPWGRVSTAYGYAQALDGTWRGYQNMRGGFWSSRHSFADAVDFIGWYANKAYIKAHIPRNDPYRLYLAYHEGVGGYMRKTYLRKPWLLRVAHKVSARSQIYRAQLLRCGR